VHSPCPRLHIAAVVAMNNAVRGVIRTSVLSHRGQTCKPLNHSATETCRERKRAHRERGHVTWRAWLLYRRRRFLSVTSEPVIFSADQQTRECTRRDSAVPWSAALPGRAGRGGLGVHMVHALTDRQTDRRTVTLPVSHLIDEFTVE